VDSFAGGVNKNARFDGEVVFDDVTTDGIIDAIARRILDRDR
jgi:hypothetical protein